MSQRISFNTDWSFQQGESAATGQELNYFSNPAVREAVLAFALPAGLRAEHTQLGAAVPYTQSAFDDGAWRKLNIPHDWAIEGPFDLKLPGETGKRPSTGVAWYRKRFRLSASDAGQRIFLDVDGAMSYAMAWCNGRFVGGWPYGYSGFRLDLTPAIAAGAENVLAIRLDNPPASARWYPGAGLYRNVWMVKSAPVHVAQWGTYVTTPEVSRERATVSLKVEIANDTAHEAAVTVETEIFLRNKRLGAIVPRSVMIPAFSTAAAAGDTFVENPQLWDLETPTLYMAVTTVHANGRAVDRYETPFGIRTIRFTTGDGFHLNGRRVPLRGVCNHHDLGALGAAFNERAAERQLEILKEMGTNALRTSHNPPAPELLDLCDRMGVLVMDESFDCWKQGKKPGDYHLLWDDWYEKDLRALCRRDRNHPSVILWSIGNEVLELKDAESGKAIASALSRIVEEEDSTRPSVVGSNCAVASYNGIQEAVGVMGQNYERGGYAEFKARNPAIPLVGSETASTLSSRGVYVFDTRETHAARYAEAVKAARERNEPDPVMPPFKVLAEGSGAGLADFQVSSYDLYSPRWGRSPDDEFRALAQNPHVAGEFVWTGFDYLGEPTPYNADLTNLLNLQDEAMRAKLAQQLESLGKGNVPSRSSYFGILDLAGFPKDRYYLYQAHWRPDLPMAHILPHWTWPERLGLATPVHVYTSGDEAELFLNGKSLGRKKKDPLAYRLRWDEAIYEPGELKVMAFKGGRPWATEVMRTAGPAAKIVLKADRAGIKADGLDLAFVTLSIVDSDLQVVPRAGNRVHFDVEGPGEIVATDNGNPIDLEPFQQRERNAFNGQAMAIVRAQPGHVGAITVKASSNGLEPASVSIQLPNAQAILIHENRYSCPERGFFTHTLAADWPEGLLLGNGSMGAIVMGRPHAECIMVGHEELFLPLFERRPVLEMAGLLPELRRLLRAGRGHEANLRVVEAARQAGYPENFLMTDPFHPGFDLLVDTGPDRKVEDYRRGVDFATGEAFIRYTDSAGGRWLQRGFVSRADGVLVMEWSCDRAFEAEVRLGIRPAKMEPWEKGTTSPGSVPKGSFMQRGLRAVSTDAEGNGVSYRAAYALTGGGCEGMACVVGKDGSAQVFGNGLRVRSGGRMLLVAALEPSADCTHSRLPEMREKLAALPADYEELLARHVARHEDLFSRVRLELGDTAAARMVPVEAHLERARTGAVEPEWMQKVFDACRYNIISSTGTLPPNLQGVWTGTWTPHWSGDYTFDANVQAAVAHYLVCGTPELMLSLFRLVERMMPDFRENARALYGTRGIFVNSRASRLGLQQRYNICPMFFWTAGGAWLAHYYYEYYLYTGDRAFLRDTALPFMREAAAFFRDFLIKDETGKYEFNPSVSPENKPANGDSLATINATMDIAAVRELLANLIAACGELGLDDPDLPVWRELLRDLPPYLANPDGALREWATPSLDDNHEHRHMSHLYPLYPGHEANMEQTPELHEMCRRALQLRMRHYNPAEYSAFGLYHLAMAAARTSEVETSFDALSRLCGWHVYTGMATAHDSGPRIFNLDASGGIPAVIAEMLLQSHEIMAEILLRLLPALPAAWPNGSVAGLLARGGIGVDIEWKDGTLEKAILRARRDVWCRVRCGNHEARIHLVAGELVDLGPELALKVNEDPANTVRDAHVLRGMLKKGG